MKTLTETIYTFSELPKDAQQKAISNNIDINVYEGWWDFIAHDLQDIFCKLVEFDLYYNSIKLEFLKDAETIASIILENHGASCQTYKIAKQFLSNEIDENQFLKQLQNKYLNSLHIEYDYLTCNQAIIETFEANDYHFDLNGKIRG
jgi:hypothetical protein